MEAISRIAQWRPRLGELQSALRLLTRLPAGPDAAAPAPAADAVWAFPIAGAIVGGLAAILYWLLVSLSLAPVLAAILAIALMVLLTGAMHEDGLADFADGLGGADREARLAIMRDHRIGTYGVLALIAVIAIRIAALATMGQAGLVAGALIGTAVIGRLAAVFLMAGVPPARSDGLSAAAGRPQPVIVAVAVLIAFAIGWAALSFALALLLICATGLVALGLGLYAKSRLGGQTGDVLGTAIALSEAFGLVLLAWIAG